MNEPIFIVGMGRSGTSFLTGALDRHPGISMYSESWFFTHIWKGAGRRSLGRDPVAIDRAIGKFQNLERANISPDVLRERFLATDGSQEALLDTLLRLKMEQDGKRRFGEKTPNHFLFLEEILRIYPDAKIIFTYRDPRDTFSSFKHGPYCQELRLLDRFVVGRALLWNAAMRALSRHASGVPPDQLRIVRFEDMVSAPEETLRSLCEFLGEPFDDDMLQAKTYSSFAAPEGSDGDGEGSRDRRKYLRGWELLTIELICGQHLVERGYPTTIVPAAAIHVFRRAGFYTLLRGFHAVAKKARGRGVP